MRCVPQVHGVVNDTINFVRGILTTEMNSALDNPVHKLSNCSDNFSLEQCRTMEPGTTLYIS